jgi:hypothetical protein
MKPWIWLRVLAILLVIFAVGHTLGTAAPKVTRGPQEAAVFAAMQEFRFPIMGFERTYWDFFRGFALIISVLFVLMAAIAWQVGTLSKQSRRLALPMAITLLIGCVGLFILSWIFFFGAPIVNSALCVVCSTVAVALLAKDRPGNVSYADSDRTHPSEGVGHPVR